MYLCYIQFQSADGVRAIQEVLQSADRPQVQCYHRCVCYNVFLWFYQFPDTCVWILGLWTRGNLWVSFTFFMDSLHFQTVHMIFMNTPVIWTVSVFDKGVIFIYHNLLCWRFMSHLDVILGHYCLFCTNQGFFTLT